MKKLDKRARKYDTIQVVKQLLKISFSLLLLFVAFFEITLAQENTATDGASIKNIKYDLAYPGILPDHPLYILKKIRDKATAFLISDPQKKVEFYLLQTDKGILATAMLIDNNKIDIAKDTAFKAEHNYTLLTYELKKIKRADVESSYLQKLKTAALKHQEILAYIIKKVPAEKQKPFEQVLNFSKTNLQTVLKYEMRKPLQEEP